MSADAKPIKSPSANEGIKAGSKLLRGTIAEDLEYAKMHGGWISARLGRLPKAAPFQPGTEMKIRGVTHPIVQRAGERGTECNETRDSGEKILCVAGDPDFT